MTTNQNAQRYLEIEEAAGDLVQTLESLLTEVQHYSAASSSLDEAREAIGPAAAKYAELAVQIESVVAALREVGMPAVLDSLGELRSSTESHLAEVAGNLEGLSAAVQSGTEKFSSGLAEMRVTSKQVFEQLKSSEGQIAAKVGSLRLLVASGIAIATGLGAVNLVLVLMAR